MSGWGVGYLTDKWFLPVNASNLRFEMRRKILELMAVSALNMGQAALHSCNGSGAGCTAHMQWKRGRLHCE